jgi:hypothetical protein
VVAKPSIAGVSVDRVEADSVALHLWSYLVTARHYRDPEALALVESGPALGIDREICMAGCPPPPLYSEIGLSTILPQQTSWPADFLATVSYAGDCPKTPCDDSFVAVQQHKDAAWTIVLFVSYSGTPMQPAEGQTFEDWSVQRALGFSPTLYLYQYAAYLQAIKDTDKPPTSTWLLPGPFTTGYVAGDYVSPATHAADGYSDTIKYAPGNTPIYSYQVGVNDALVCATVNWTDTSTALPGMVLVQPLDRSSWGATLAPGQYSQIVDRGTHMNCYLIWLGQPKQGEVMGNWDGSTQATGS